MSMRKPKAQPLPPPPPPPPNTPTRADSSVYDAGNRTAPAGGYTSFVATSTQGLTRKPNTNKRTLIGGT